LRLNDGVLKSTSECSSGNVNQSLKKASVTQAYLEFQLWQIDSRIVVVRAAPAIGFDRQPQRFRPEILQDSNRRTAAQREALS
jgi:hypothetical protein